MSAPTPPPIVMPQSPAMPPQLGSATQGQKPQRKAQQPTYIGAQMSANPSNTGQKTLLGS